MPIAVIPVGVDIAHPPEVSLAPNGGLPPELAGQPFVLYLARLHAKKGIELLLRAWAGMAGSFPKHQLVVAGAGEEGYVADCRRLVDTLGLADHCRWLGPVDDATKRALFQRADLYVLPSYSENFGNTIPEALAQGTPVLTTTRTPWTHLSAEGCGWIADATVEALQSHLTEALEAPAATRRAMGEAGRRLVEQRYSLASVVRQIDQVYTWLLGGPRPDGVLYEA